MTTVEDKKNGTHLSPLAKVQIAATFVNYLYAKVNQVQHRPADLEFTEEEKHQTEQQHLNYSVFWQPGQLTNPVATKQKTLKIWRIFSPRTLPPSHDRI